MHEGTAANPDQKDCVIAPSVWGISEHQPEDSGGGDDDALKLHDSLQSLREYLEMLNKNKNQEEPVSKEESVEDNELGPHYHTMSTNEPPMEMPPEELQDQENVGDNPPKDLYFQPIPISDKIGMAERHIQVGTGGGKQIRETVLLGVSSATLAVLLLLTVFCAAGVYYCAKPYRYSDDFSLTSSEKRAVFCPSDSSYTRTEDSSLLWNGDNSEMKRAGALSFSAYIDEISTFSEESARTAERDRIDAQRGPAPYQAEAPSVPPPAQEAPPAPVPAVGTLPPAQEVPPAPAPAEGPPAPVLPPAGVPPAPPPAEGAPPGPPTAEGAPPPGVPPPAENPPPVQ